MQYRNEYFTKLNETLGGLIFELRSEAKISGHKLACEYELDSGHLNRIEKGKVDCKITTLWKISEALGLKLSDLIKILEQELGDGFSLLDK